MAQILVADDDQFLLALTRLWLEGAGHTVSEAANVSSRVPGVPKAPFIVGFAGNSGHTVPSEADNWLGPLAPGPRHGPPDGWNGL